MSIMIMDTCIGCGEECDDFADLTCDNCDKICHEVCGNRVDLPIEFAGTFLCTDCK